MGAIYADLVIAVLERQHEIRIRRAPGATRRHQSAPTSSSKPTMLSVAVGTTGVLAGAFATAGYARVKGWQYLVRRRPRAGGLAAAVLVGALAGIFPAQRAAPRAPVDSIRAGR